MTAILKVTRLCTSHLVQRSTTLSDPFPVSAKPKQKPWHQTTKHHKAKQRYYIASNPVAKDLLLEKVLKNKN
jgi:hypothetical protein